MRGSLWTSKGNGPNSDDRVVGLAWTVGHCVWDRGQVTNKRESYSDNSLMWQRLMGLPNKGWLGRLSSGSPSVVCAGAGPLLWSGGCLKWEEEGCLILFGTPPLLLLVPFFSFSSDLPPLLFMSGFALCMRMLSGKSLRSGSGGARSRSRRGHLNPTPISQLPGPSFKTQVPKMNTEEGEGEGEGKREL